MQNYKILKSKRKTISIEVTLEGEIIVKAPMRLTEKDIQTFVEKNSAWLTKTKARVERTKYIIKPISLNKDDTLLFMGKKYQIQLIEGNNVLVDVSSDFIGVPLLFTKKMLKKWYFRQAEEIITNKVVSYAQQLNAHYSKIKFTAGIGTIGSCTSRGYLNFSWFLILMPEPVIDYVVVHEICHLFVHNHSKKFWDLVAQTVPNYKDLRKVIKSHSKDLYMYKKYL